MGVQPLRIQQSIQQELSAGASLNWNSYPLGLPHSGSNITSVNHAYYVDISRASEQLMPMFLYILERF